MEAGNGDRVAFHWRGEEGEERDVTYADLHRDVQRFANALKDNGIEQGDVVGIFLPMIPEVVVAMLACARIGAPHNVVFGGFSPDSVRERMEFSDAKALITVDGARRKGKTAPIKQAVDEVDGRPATRSSGSSSCGTPSADCEMQDGRDVWYHEAIEAADAECEAEPLDAEHPLYILYTSGSTAKPKGILHTTGGYLTGAAYTQKYVFDLKPEEDVWWCSADVGWVTGHSYIVYGPLLNGATSVMYEGAPDYPDKDIWWELCDRYDVTLFYTAPTAIRACMKWGAEYPNQHDLSKLRLLGSVGEPINPKAWLWYHKVIGGERCPIVDTWWQTETGHILISPLPGITTTKPGSATVPLPGVKAAVLDEDGEEMDEGQGLLVLQQPWPGMLRTLYQEDERFIETYFEKFGKQTYLVGDAARRDEDGYIWVVGRIDDVINVSGHRMSTAEVESAIVSHSKVAESAVIGQSRRGHRPGDLRLRHPGGRPRGLRRAGGRDPRARGQADRQAGAAQAGDLVRRPAQDALGQDHAPPAARHRRGPRAGRRDHPARSRRDEGAGGQGGRAPEGGRGVGGAQIGPALSDRSARTSRVPTANRTRRCGRHPGRRPRPACGDGCRTRPRA